MFQTFKLLLMEATFKKSLLCTNLYYCYQARLRRTLRGFFLSSALCGLPY